MVDVVVLSGDLALFEGIRSAVGERNPVWRARSAEESVDLLVTGRCGVLLIDMAAVAPQPTGLIEQIVGQFPDVVVVVAGRREDETALAALVSDGLVYRFMHKPLSPKRAGMFLNAAMRSHLERRGGRVVERLLPLARELRSRIDPRKWWFVGGGIATLLLLFAAVLSNSLDELQPGDATGASAAVHSTGPLADPVLSRARAALAAGRYEAPAGRNALDLYSAVLLTSPDNVEAKQGLATTIGHLLEAAERAANDGDVEEARRIAGRVLQADPDNAGARSVLASTAPRPQPVAEPPAATEASPASAVAQATQKDPPAAPVSVAAANPETQLPPRPAARTEPLPVPVTSLASLRPAPAPVVRPDPLAPRVVGGALPTTPSGPKPPLVARRIDAPVAPSLPVAGYVQRPQVPATITPVAPAGVQARDLEPVATPDPAYPPGAFRAGIEGWVEVEYTVTERGVTRDVQVVAADPRGAFDEAAIDAVAGWKYRPRVVNGQPVAQRASATLRFTIDD
jgi:protein TonB